MSDPLDFWTSGLDSHLHKQQPERSGTRTNVFAREPTAQSRANETPALRHNAPRKNVRSGDPPHPWVSERTHKQPRGANLRRAASRRGKAEWNPDSELPAAEKPLQPTAGRLRPAAARECRRSRGCGSGERTVTDGHITLWRSHILPSESDRNRAERCSIIDEPNGPQTTLFNQKGMC